MDKQFRDCDFVDSFFININPSGSCPLNLTFNLPILMQKDIRYIRIKSINVTSETTTTAIGTVVIKCDFIASSDKTIATITLNGAGTEETYYSYSDQLLKVVTPLAGLLNFYITSAPAPTNVLNAHISMGVECYK